MILRSARREDAADLARLVDMAGEGLPRHLWGGMAAPGEDPFAVGARRAAREAGAFSWRNATIAEIGGAVAGALVAYRIAAAPAPLDDLPAVFRPMQALENRALGSFYVNVLATYPALRRRGVGRTLLGAAETQAAAAGAHGLSLIVADRNAPAIALYRARGYDETAREPIVKDGWACISTQWVLMQKPLRGPGG